MLYVVTVLLEYLTDCSVKVYILLKERGEM